MRYILDNDGYIELCSATPMFCNGRGCTEYTGEVPAGYESMEDWAVNADIRAYKIVDGNLVYDVNRRAVLEARYDKEAEDNRYVCHKEISNITNLTKTDSVDAYKRSTTGLSNILEVTDSNKFSSEYIKLIANEDVHVYTTIKFNNGNLLTNDATSKRESGINFAVNADRSISMSGTATEDIEFNIGGTNTSTTIILVLKKNTDYYLSSNGYVIKMYNYNGAERTEVYNGTGGVINLSSNSPVTNIVLTIPKGTTVNDTIYPMLNLGTTANEYVTYQGNETTIYLDGNELNAGGDITIYEGTTLLKGTVLYPSIDKAEIQGLKPTETLTPTETLEPSNYQAAIEALYPSENMYAGYTTFCYLDDCIMPYTYLDKTYMYAYDDLDLIVTYPNTEKDLDLCGYETPNKGFVVDEEGNIYVNNGTFRGHVEASSGTFDGKVTSNEGSVGGWTINSSGLTNGKVFIRNDGYSTIYTAADIFILRAILMEEEWATVQKGTAEFNRYDLNGDGVINSNDLLTLRNMLLGN